MLEFDLPPGHVCLVSGDGSTLTTALVRRLDKRGWPVVLLYQRTPGAAAPELPEQVPVVALDGNEEGAVRDALVEIQRHGPVGTVVIVHPQPAPDRGAAVETGAGPWDATSLRLPFLLAKHLQPVLNAAAALSSGTRVGFVTVTRLDGALGLTGRSSGSPIQAGVLGMTKALRLEWPEVFCRAVDLDPDMATDAAAHAVVAELLDPDRLTAEVGWGREGRVTLTAVAEACADTACGDTGGACADTGGAVGGGVA
jgi:NAD(P)-dependent dehydrogenase (short-subunit alcohol dehydrogenase family)